MIINKAYTKFRTLTIWSFLSQSADYMSDVTSAMFSTIDDGRDSEISRSTRRKIWLYKKGFVTYADELFQFNENDPRNYLSHFDRYFLPKRINNNSSDILDNKVLFHKILMGKHDQYLPYCHGFIHDGVVYEISSGKSGISNWISNQGFGFVAKRAVSAQGKDVYIVESGSDGFYLNGHLTSANKIGEILSDGDWVLTEIVSQAEYSNRIFADSVNTMRIITIIDSKTGDPFIANAVHRFGGRNSAPIDNWSQGGACADIDLETGELKEVATFKNKKELKYRNTHPDTRERITGVQIPEWEHIKKAVLELADELRVCPYIGWDVVLTSENQVCVIEGNSSPGNEAIQAHEGLFQVDDRVERSLRNQK